MAIIQTAHGAINQYMGARYVPKLMDDWAENIKYDYLNQVNYFGDAYISKKPVPLGTPPTDTEYWMRFPYGARLDEAFAQIAAANKRIDKNAGDIGDLQDFTTALNGRIIQAESNIINNTQKIASLQYELNDHKARTQQSFREVRDEMIRNDEKYNDADVALRNGLNALTTEVNQSKSDLSGLTGRMTTAEGKISVLENTTNAQGTNISQLQSTVASHTQSIAGLKDTESNLLTRVGANESSIVKLQAEDTALDARIESLEYTAGDHTTRIQRLEQGEEQIELTQANVNIMYPPASSGLSGMVKSHTVNQTQKFESIATWAQSNGYGLYIPSGNFNVDGAVIGKSLNIQGNGINSVLLGDITILGISGRVSAINDVEFRGNITTDTDMIFNNVIFRNSGLKLISARQIYLNNCQFYLTNTEKTSQAILMQGKCENIRILNCLLLSEPSVGVGIKISNPNGQNSSNITINAVIAGYGEGLNMEKVDNMIITGCDIYNVDEIFAIERVSCVFDGCNFISTSNNIQPIYIGSCDVKMVGTNIVLNKGYIHMMNVDTTCRFIASGCRFTQSPSEQLFSVDAGILALSACQLTFRAEVNPFIVFGDCAATFSGCYFNIIDYAKFANVAGTPIVRLYGCLVGKNIPPASSVSYITVV